MSKFFCGIGNIPTGKVIGTPQQCLDQKQIRYYGKVAVDPKIIKARGQPNLLKEQIKLLKLHQDAKLLVKEFNMNKIALTNDELSKAKRKRLLNKKDQMILKRDRLKKQLNNQTKKVEQLRKKAKN